MQRQPWEVVIGLETHTQLTTRSKMFSGASTAFGAAPNTQACAVDLALPGSLPVANRAAVQCAIRFGLAIGARIAERSVFARKNYFYPDLPKGYQISQYELPVVDGGTLAISWKADDQPDTAAQHKVIRLTRAHLEEDAGKSLHEDAMRTLGGMALAGVSGIDLNRAGTPLLEIVTEPDMRSAREAVAYAKTLHALVMWLGICDGNMQEGSFRCDANVSVRPRGQEAFGTRCEIKNLNSFRFLERAIDFEVRRQIELIEDGGRVVQETRLYDPDRDETRSMRSKEDAHDYRYFPDPDLPPLRIEPDWIESERARMPELPDALLRRFGEDYGLSAHEAQTLAASRAMATWFEQMLTHLPGGAARAEVPPGSAARAQSAKAAANWMLGEVSAALNRDGIDLGQLALRPVQMARLVARVLDGTVSNKSAKEVFQRLWNERDAAALARDDLAEHLIESMGLRQMSDTGAIEAIVDQVLAANARSVEEFRAGKEKAFNALVGQVMKATKGKANPQSINELLRRKLGGS